MKVIGVAVAIASLVALSSCYGETFDSVTMRRASDGAIAVCSSGTYPVPISIFERDKRPPLSVTRCVAACERMGFVVVESFPRSDLVIKTNEVDGVSEAECSVR